MALWIPWFNALVLLRPAFSRHTTFLWFMVCIAGLSVRNDHLGVTSVVRALCISEKRYYNLLRCCHSKAIKLPELSRVWTKCVMALFSEQLERSNGRIILIADGKKMAKSGRKMPGVKSLHQESEANSKPAYIMGHSAQCVSVLVRAASSWCCVPLDMKIHEGTVYSNRDNRTLLDKLLSLVAGLDIEVPFYLVADAYYSNGKMINGLLKGGNHLISRARSNSVAYHPAPKVGAKRSRGRPKVYGRKVKLKSLFRSANAITVIPSPVYGEKNIDLRVRTVDLLWKPVGQLVRFVLVEHPTRGCIILLSSDLSMEASEIIRLYGLRFKIELGFKQAAHVIGSYEYHFWMADMKPIGRRSGNQYLHRETEKYRQAVKRKQHAYHVYLFMGIVTQGLMQYLSACHTDAVWKSFGSWLRTIRKGVAPSELVVTMALRNTLCEFLCVSHKTNKLAKFIIKHQDPHRAAPWASAA